jgi:hypothetical protein
MAFSNVDQLPLGALLQPKQGTGLGKKRKKSLVDSVRKKGYPGATAKR